METAREMAEMLVAVQPNHNSNLTEVCAFGLRHCCYSAVEAQELAAVARSLVSIALHTHATEAVAECRSSPVPGPATDLFLELWRKGAEGGRVTYHQEFRLLFQHIDFLTALLRDCAADGALAIRQQGYEAGWREGCDAAARVVHEWGAHDVNKEVRDNPYYGGAISVTQFEAKYGQSRDLLAAIASVRDGEVSHVG